MGNRMKVIADWEKVPSFTENCEEMRFWRSHRPDVRLMENSLAQNAGSSESVTITLRMDPRMLSSIKRLARSRFLNYQSMIKQWLSERMEQEQRLQKNGND
ncbi:MAG: CopG family antitoxin [Verrucomicrobiota bacterium]|nr:CopG family antitoxin [Verrucomicrobiota bacterium]